MNHHRYAVVVQDLATQWLQCPCKTKVIYTDISLEFGKACEELSWNHCASTLHRSETNGIAERAVRRIQEEMSAAYCSNQTWVKNEGLIPWNAVAIFETSKTSWQMRTRFMHEKVQLFSEYHPISAKGSQGSGKETWNMLWMCVDRGSSERRYCGCRH